MAKIKLTEDEVKDLITDKYGQGEVVLRRNGAEIDTKGKTRRCGFKHEDDV